MRTLLLATTLLFTAPSALASDPPTHRAELLAWSTDGHTALVRETTTTPNGGGERALRLLSRVGPKRVVVSQIEDPDAKSPQRVSERTCVQRLKTFGKLLQKRGFPEVTLSTACEDRAQVVTVGRSETAKAADTWFAGDISGLTRSDLRLNIKRNILTLTNDHKTVGSWADTPEPLQIRAAVSPTGSLMLILYGWGPGNWRVMKVLASKSGAPTDFKAVRI